MNSLQVDARAVCGGSNGTGNCLVIDTAKVYNRKIKLVQFVVQMAYGDPCFNLYQLFIC